MVSFVPETLFYLWKLPVTNTLLDTLLVDALIIIGLYFLNKHKSNVPNFFQNIVEYIFDIFYGLTQTISPKYVHLIFPWFMSFFLFIFLSNWSGLIPGFGTIGIYRDHELVPFFRSASSDLNLTFAFAIIATIATHKMAIQKVGIKDYLARYFSLNPIFLFVGLLEILSIFTNIISLSFRLFGNIYAGDVVLTTISSMFAFVLPLPFLALEMIVGLVQALVFSMLTMVYMSVLTTPHHEEAQSHA